jgi:hypothetical protein
VVDTDAGTNPGNGSNGSKPVDPNALSGVVDIVTIHNTAKGSTDSGSSVSDFITNDNTVYISGTSAFSTTGAAVGDLLRIDIKNSADQTIVSQYITPDANGNWALDRTQAELADGKYTIVANIVDKSGNTVKVGDTQVMVIDTNQGGKETGSNPANGSGNEVDPNKNAVVAISTIHVPASNSVDSGTNNDFVTNDPTLIIQGTITGFSSTGGAAGDQLRVRLLDSKGQVVAEQFSTPTATTWSFDNRTSTLADGQYTIEAAIVDAAYNTVKAANPQAARHHHQQPRCHRRHPRLDPPSQWQLGPH